MSEFVAILVGLAGLFCESKMMSGGIEKRSSFFVYLLVVIGVLCLCQVFVGACNESLKAFGLPTVAELLPLSPWENFALSISFFFLLVKYSISWVRKRIGFKGESQEEKRKEWASMIMENFQSTTIFLLFWLMYIYLVYLK